MPTVSRLFLVTVLATAVATPAVAAPKRNPQSPQATAAYWTAERMKNATPRDRAKPGGSAGGAATTSDWTRYTVPYSGGTYTGANAQNGKVFFTIGGSNYVCSGTAVTASAGVNLVWTAGHCTTDGADPAAFASKFMFVPGYLGGAEPFGRWTYTEIDSTPGWEGQGSDRFRNDVGAARVVNADPAAAASGASFATTIGTRPIRFGQNPTGQRLVSYGYPAAGRFNGSQQFACASPFRRWDTLAFTDPMQISCDMTGGSSGGGWFLDSNANNVGDAGEPLVSVNSYGYQAEKNTMYGPYMATQAQALYNSMD